jgi:oxamate amidohydrolase
MLTSSMGYKGAVSAPHRAAALAGRDILDAGGTAIEAMVAAAAAIAVAYPHMNGIGGRRVLADPPPRPAARRHLGLRAGGGAGLARMVCGARGHRARCPPAGRWPR